MKIVKEGIEVLKVNTPIFVFIMAVVTATALRYDWPWWLLTVVDGFLLWRIIFAFRFFRDPIRELVQDPQIIYAPADGKVVVVERVVENEVMGGECLQLSIYMDFYDVHVNWNPIGGTVVYKDHFNGDFLLAWRPKSSELNEHTTVGVQTDSGHRIMYRQIAGWIARRIVCYAEVGSRVEQNHKAGFIKFGSRMDVFVPLGSQVLVELGQRVVGSQTPLVRLPELGK